MNLAMPVLLFALHSLVAGGAQRHWLQACLPDGHQPQCLSLSLAPDFPQFAQAVRYGVPGNSHAESPDNLG